MKWWLIAATALILMTLPATLAQTEIFKADRGTLELTIDNEIQLIRTGGSAHVSEASAELKWFPRESSNQDVESIETSPLAKDKLEHYLFSWQQPRLGTYDIQLHAIISTNNDIFPVQDKVPFPLKGVTPDLLPYTQAQGMIDINDDMRDLASELAYGKDDLYEVVFALADWTTTNIEYELSSLTAEATYPSSWVMENKYGVCDEITSLFISLNRALGIPARFVSGLAYTNMEEVPEGWGAHGWAEVYFPKHGWIPFDVTYGEYGYLDAGHIKLHDSISSEGTSISVTGIGRQFQIKTDRLDFDVNVLGERSREYDVIAATLQPYADEIGFGSYNLLTLQLQNLRNQYVSTKVEIGQTTQMAHESPDALNVLLGPREKKELYFLIKVADNLEQGYTYTFPVSAHTKLGSPVTTEFTATTRGPMLAKGLFDEYFSAKEKRTAKIDIDCDYPEYAKVGEATVTCDIFNREEDIPEVRACIDESCTRFSLKRQESKTVQAALARDEPGIYTIPVIVSNGQLQKTTFLTLNMLDEARMGIIDLEAPDTIEFDEMGVLSFTVVRESLAAPKSVRAYIEHPKFYHAWESLQIQTAQEYVLRFYGQSLDAGDNTLTVMVEYDDVFGETHTVSKDVQIALINLGFGERVELWFESAALWLENVL